MRTSIEKCPITNFYLASGSSKLFEIHVSLWSEIPHLTQLSESVETVGKTRRRHNTFFDL